MSDDLLVKNGTIVTLDENGAVVESGAVWIRDGLVEEVGPEHLIGPGQAELPTLDAGGGVVLPGWVNAHVHLYSTFARGVRLPGDPPRNFIEILEKLWWRLDRTLTDDDVYYSALTAAVESVKAGTTTLIDHHASPFACANSLSLIRDALDSVGMRGVLAYEVSDRDGRAEQGIAENVRFIEQARRKQTDRFAGLFGLHASFTLSDATLAACREAAEAVDAPFHIHVGEDRHDLEHARREHGKGVVKRLADAGILGPGSIAAHCIHLEEGDEALLRERGVTVAHCPQSNTNNAVGTADILRLLASGVTVGLGTDGFTMSMLDETQVAAIIHRLAQRDPAVGMMEAVEMLTRTNPAIASRYLSPRFGALSPGHAGDLAVYRYDPPTPLVPETVAGHLLFGLRRAPVNATVVGGRIVQRDGRVERLDEERLFARARELAGAFWKRFEAV